MKLPEGLQGRLTARGIPLDPAKAAQILRSKIVFLGQGGGGRGLHAARRDVLSMLRGVEETAGVAPISTRNIRAERRQGKGPQIVAKPFGNGIAINTEREKYETFTPAPRTYPGLDRALWPDVDPDTAPNNTVVKRLADGSIIKKQYEGVCLVYDPDGAQIGQNDWPYYGRHHSYLEAARAYEGWRQAQAAAAHAAPNGGRTEDTPDRLLDVMSGAEVVKRYSDGSEIWMTKFGGKSGFNAYPFGGRLRICDTYAEAVRYIKNNRDNRTRSRSDLD